MVTPATHEEERQSYTEFASRHGLQVYRRRLADLYAAWHRFNDTYCGGRLIEPHLTLDRTAPRSLGHCAPTTGYGGKVQITLHGGLVFGTKRDWVVRPWPPAEGTGRFIEDLLLRLTVQQWVLECVRADESGYRGFGPFFVGQANVIGAGLGLGPVVARRRGPEDSRPVALNWPHCVRPAGYYGTDLTEELLDLVGCRRVLRRLKAAPAPHRGLLELLRHLWDAGRPDEVRQLIERHLEWAAPGRPSPPKRPAVEAGERDVDGSPLGEVVLQPEWLAWNGGTVRWMARAIEQGRSFLDLPLLADALEEAGCDDGRILRHLRERMEHGRRCWVLRRILRAEEAKAPSCGA